LKKVNFANVRSAIRQATIALGLLLLAAPGAAAKEPPRVLLAWLPAATSVREIATSGLAPGLLSAGLGTVPPQQTYLDVSQGNRVFNSLYSSGLPALAGNCPSWWGSVLERANSAPAEIVPALLTSTLEAAGRDVRAGGGASCVF
jgi:hypothetical protein